MVVLRRTGGEDRRWGSLFSAVDASAVVRWDVARSASGWMQANEGVSHRVSWGCEGADLSSI